MSNISILKQYNELDEYTQIKEYINKVLDNFNDLDNIDSNDIYELVYAKKLCTSKINQGIENVGTRKAFEDTLVRLELIIDLLNDDIIKKALKNPLNKHKVANVNSAKLSKTNKIPSLKDKSKPKYGNPTEEYFKKIIVKLLISGLLLLFLLTGGDITRLLSEMVVELGNAGADTATHVVADVEQTNELINSLQNTLNIMIRLITMVMIMVTSISTMMDIMYIAFPMFRYMVDSRDEKGMGNTASFVSSNAIEAVQMEGAIVGYHYTDSYDKVSTAEVLLDNMLNSLKCIPNSDMEAEAHIGNLIKIKNRVNDCKEKYGKIVNLADAEIYYINNRDYFNNILKED